MAVKIKIAHALANIGRFIFNKKTKEVLGRTWQSWVHLAVFVALTPTPGYDTTPWNYGLYGYPNYPNIKIVLVSHPKIFTYRRTDNESVLSQIDSLYIHQHLLPSANASGVSSECLDEASQHGYNIERPCIFIHVLKVYNWIPENFINETIDTMLVRCTFTSSNLDLNVTSTMGGIPLNIPNEGSRSFPFKGQSDYKIPLMAIQLNFTGGVPSQTPSAAYQGTVTCSVDLEGMGLSVPTAEILSRHYDIPEDSTTKIMFV
ncbi:uncharacterized protein LOC135341424 isoform X2 [Halichondria panicea]|uniref:uncharacterized protein LOC135341424 isoform X2 n=1 Tax=Halichondria panicea TaxID=6063 RepID=UPI00312BACD7